MVFSQLSLFQKLLKRKGRSSKPAPLTEVLPEPAASSRQLETIWRQLQRTYFPDSPNLGRYTIKWSQRRQKRTLASCSLLKKSVTVAKELNHPSLHIWLEPLLYHEMCHAVLNPLTSELVHRGVRRSWHGAEFKALERQHPQMRSFDLWIKSGGWQTAIRSDRARNALRKKTTKAS